MGELVIVLVAFFAIWIGIAFYGWRQKWSVVLRFGGGFLAAAIIVPVVAQFVLPQAKAMSAASISSVEDARQFLIGTWTYTQPIDQNSRNASYVSQWEKWVIKGDGTVDVYMAPPVADSWGKPETKSYEIYTAKYVDTGERYYGIRLKGMLVRAHIVKDDVLGLTVSSSEPVPMVRGDRNPFSK